MLFKDFLTSASSEHVPVVSLMLGDGQQDSGFQSCRVSMWCWRPTEQTEMALCSEDGSQGF